jgi:hypothetical protein
MTATVASPQCPFCRAPLDARADTCAACSARKQPRRGMSLRSFRWFVATWLACAVVVLGLAVAAAADPWRAGREAPGYAYRLVGVPAPGLSAPRCRIEVVDGAGRTQVQVTEAACGAAGAAPQAPVAAPPDPGPRRLAAAVHSGLVLALGLLAAGGLLPLVRRLFLQRGTATWVRRAGTA